MSLEEARKAQVAQTTNIVKDAHQLLLNDPRTRNKLPEYLFKSNFLPLFAGLETHPDVTIGMWVSVAGTPFAEVDIIDDQGQILFSVPPIFERHVVDSTVERPMPLSVVTDTVEKMLIQNPFRAEAFLHHQLNQIVTPDEVLERWRNAYASRMDEIFARYGVIPAWATEVPSPTTAVAKPSNNTGPKPDLIYDEDIL